MLADDRLHPYGRISVPRVRARDLSVILRDAASALDAGISVSRGATVIDIGADVGAFTIAAALRTGGAIEAWCVEPDPAAYEALERNLWTNEWLSGGKHTALHKAISGPRGLSELIKQSGVERVGLLRVAARGNEVEVLSSAGPSAWARIEQAVVEIDAGVTRTRAVLAVLITHGLSRLRVLEHARGLRIIAARHRKIS